MWHSHIWHCSPFRNADIGYKFTNCLRLKKPTLSTFYNKIIINHTVVPFFYWSWRQRNFYTNKVSRDSSVGIATGYGLDGPGIESQSPMDKLKGSQEDGNTWVTNWRSCRSGVGLLWRKWNSTEGRWDHRRFFYWSSYCEEQKVKVYVERKSRGNPVSHVNSIFYVTFLWKHSEYKCS
jgi:hypothetical protein